MHPSHKIYKGLVGLHLNHEPMMHSLDDLEMPSYLIEAPSSVSCGCVGVNIIASIFA